MKLSPTTVNLIRTALITCTAMSIIACVWMMGGRGSANCANETSTARQDSAASSFVVSIVVSIYAVRGTIVPVRRGANFMRAIGFVSRKNNDFAREALIGSSSFPTGYVGRQVTHWQDGG